MFVRNLAKPYVSFGSSWEFWAYQVWAVGSLVSYPAMTVLFEYCLTSLERHKLLAAVEKNTNKALTLQLWSCSVPQAHAAVVRALLEGRPLFSYGLPR